MTLGKGLIHIQKEGQTKREYDLNRPLGSKANHDKAAIVEIIWIDLETNAITSTTWNVFFHKICVCGWCECHILFPLKQRMWEVVDILNCHFTCCFIIENMLSYSLWQCKIYWAGNEGFITAFCFGLMIVQQLQSAESVFKPILLKANQNKLFWIFTLCKKSVKHCLTFLIEYLKKTEHAGFEGEGLLINW